LTRKNQCLLRFLTQWVNSQWIDRLKLEKSGKVLNVVLLMEEYISAMNYYRNIFFA